MRTFQPFGRLPVILLVSGSLLLAGQLTWQIGWPPVKDAIQTALEKRKHNEARRKEEQARQDVIQHWWGTEVVPHPCTRLAYGTRIPVSLKAGERRDFCEADYNRQIAWTKPVPGCVRGLAETTPFRQGTCDGVDMPGARLHSSRVTFIGETHAAFLVCDQTCED